jgi:hypothetical protein
MSTHVEQAASGVAAVAAKNGPPLIVTGLSFLGVPLQEWVYIATILWIVYQFAMDVRKRLRDDQCSPR